MAEPSVTVALATLDGDRWLTEFFDSLVEQTRRPDEVVVRDDGSRDGTLDLLDAFAQTAPFPVRVTRADQAQGPRRAFDAALAMAEGDVVLLADQDDVWRQDHVSKLLDAVGADGVTMAFSDATFVDEAGRPLPGRLWRELHVDDALRARLAEGDPGPVLSQAITSGCTMAVRRSVLDLSLPIPDVLDGPAHPVLHDRWLSWVASCTGRVVDVPEPLVAYRRHPAQVTSAQRTRVVPEVLGQLRRDLASVRDASLVRLAQAEELERRVRDHATPRAQQVLAEFRAFLVARADLPVARRHRMGEVRRLQRSGAYEAFSSGVAAAATDLLRPGGGGG